MGPAYRPAPVGAAKRGLLLVMAKTPEAGLAKTRLAPRLGPAGAARLARAFLEDTWTTSTALASVAPVLVLTGDGTLPLLTPSPTIWPQGSGDLGARLERVFRRALAIAPWAVAIGTDSPHLPAGRLEQAVRLLASGRPAVIGPADDGGYYLIGLRACPAGTFANLPWSTRETLTATIARLRGQGSPPELLESWFDIDTHDDLERLRARLHAGEVVAPATSEALRSMGLMACG